jgi:hypothetical protein
MTGRSNALVQNAETRDVRSAIGDTPGVTDAPRPSAAPLSGGPRTVLAVLSALVIGVAAACGSSAPTPSPTPTSSPTASASSSARPLASAKVDPGAAALTAFVALVTKPGFSYQATFTGHSRHATDIFPISKGLLQVSGADVLVRATWTFPTGSSTVEHRYVAGKAWIRYDVTATWHRLTFTKADSMAAFASARSTADVTDLGPITSGGKTYYQVSFRSAIVNPVMIPAINLSDTLVTKPRLTLLIDAAGRPVKGTAEIEGQGRVSGQLQEIVIDLALTFTKVGQAVSIKAP